jgi:hypothetical protein
MNTRHALLTAAVLLFVAAPAVRAGDPPPRPGNAPSVSVVARAGLPNSSFGASRGTAIIGNAWTDKNAPIKNAHLRLRNAITGKIEANTIANEAGQFTFANIEGGAYVVEMVNDAGKLLTVGHVFNIAPGETVGTFVRLGTKVPWFPGFFGNTAAAAASSAASQGITALAPVVRASTNGS